MGPSHIPFSSVFFRGMRRWSSSLVLAFDALWWCAGEGIAMGEAFGSVGTRMGANPAPLHGGDARRPWQRRAGD